MRTVAALLAILTLVALVPPTGATDQCFTNPGAGHACVGFDVPSPVPAPYADHYYLWIGWGSCIPSPTSPNCRGTPAAPGSGVPLPTGGAVGVNQFGTLYQETNGVPGLQRFDIFYGGARESDRMILV